MVMIRWCASESVFSADVTLADSLTLRVGEDVFNGLLDRYYSSWSDARRGKKWIESKMDIPANPTNSFV